MVGKSLEDDRPVAILLANPRLNRVVGAVRMVLSPFSRISVFHREQVDELARAVLRKELRGIVVVRFERRPSIEGLEVLLQERVRVFAEQEGVSLLGMLDIPPIHSWSADRIVAIAHTIAQWVTGIPGQDLPGEFSLTAFLYQVVPQGTDPGLARESTLQRPIRVVVVDDRLDALPGISAILSVWPNLELHICLVEDGVLPVLPEGIDIALLDGVLGSGGVSDARVWMAHRRRPDLSHTVWASISTQEPEFLLLRACALYQDRAWFSGKHSITCREHSARQFVMFMNGLIAILEERLCG